MKPSLTYESLVDWQRVTGGVSVKASLDCAVTDVAPDKPLY
jgi:hypothetical protein